jgi:hypothetical protein
LPLETFPQMKEETWLPPDRMIHRLGQASCDLESNSDSKSKLWTQTLFAHQLAGLNLSCTQYAYATLAAASACLPVPTPDLGSNKTLKVSCSPEAVGSVHPTLELSSCAMDRRYHASSNKLFLQVAATTGSVQQECREIHWRAGPRICGPSRTEFWNSEFDKIIGFQKIN